MPPLAFELGWARTVSLYEIIPYSDLEVTDSITFEFSQSVIGKYYGTDFSSFACRKLAIVAKILWKASFLV